MNTILFIVIETILISSLFICVYSYGYSRGKIRAYEEEKDFLDEVNKHLEEVGEILKKKSYESSIKMYLVYQNENGNKKLLSVCESCDSLAKIILYYNEQGYKGIKAMTFMKNVPYIDLFKNDETAFTDEQKKR